jgi:hypothetical protein
MKRPDRTFTNLKKDDDFEEACEIYGFEKEGAAL